MKKILQALLIIAAAQISFDIFAQKPEYPGFDAFRNFVIQGKTEEVQRGINSNELSAEELSLLLCLAAFEGHVGVVELILRRRDEIPLEEIEDALNYALDKGYSNIALLLRTQD
jgi:hypothetical protein